LEVAILAADAGRGPRPPPASKNLFRRALAMAKPLRVESS